MMEAGVNNTTPKEKIILSVGTFSKRKNHPNLVSGYLDSLYNKEYCLALVGDKNKVFRDGGIDEETLEHTNIEIYPTLTEPELIAMYQKAEVLVSLSLYEGFGIPILEGLFNGCKVVCSDIPVYRELFSGYVSFCDPLDLDSITAAINDLEHIPSFTPSQFQPLLEKYNYTNAAQVILEQINKGGK
jgi:glycosyltransferase involved in cell wall biosynthesis